MKRYSFPSLLMLLSLIGCSAPDTDNRSQLSFDYTNPAEAGLIADSLDQITFFLQDAVKSDKIPGAVFTVVKDGALVYEESVGMSDAEDEIEMQSDHIFRMASMTKPITSVAVLMLAEQGRLSVDDPVSDFIPEFTNASILESVDLTDTTWTTRPAENEVTIHHLLTHTSGIAYGFINEQLNAVYKKAGVPDGTVMDGRTIKETMAKLGSLPLLHEPGSKWTYGLSTDVLGRVVEAASGMALDQFFQGEIFGPLGMEDTGFNLSPEKHDRVVALYRNAGPNNLTRVSQLSIEGPDTLNTESRQMPQVNYFSGGSGLMGSANDYQRFLQTVLNGGTFGGVTLFGEETARYLKENQIDGLRLGDDGFSYAFMVTLPDGDHKNLREAGRLQWGGLFQTHFWIDPARNSTVVLMTQVYPSRYQQELYNGVELRLNRSFFEL